jgi:DNA-binding NarL/FixJ family response regulator
MNARKPGLKGRRSCSPVKPDTRSRALLVSHNSAGTLAGASAPAEEAAKGACQRIRTLIADDCAVFRRAALGLLAKLPQIEMVGTAEDGIDALALVASTRPDLVLMDMQMPRLNGLQATRKIRAEFPGVRVIMTTFNNSEESKAASVASGVDWFIPKEALRDELPGAVAQLFCGRAGVAEGARP